MKFMKLDDTRIKQSDIATSYIYMPSKEIETFKVNYGKLLIEHYFIGNCSCTKRLLFLSGIYGTY